MISALLSRKGEPSKHKAPEPAAASGDRPPTASSPFTLVRQLQIALCFFLTDISSIEPLRLNWLNSCRSQKKKKKVRRAVTDVKAGKQKGSS